jgi:hypothetical protein
LLVHFANDARLEDEKIDAVGAAVLAGRTRLRPVLMTAAAMILGMLPMAIGLGEGGQQNAPLGRAVIGGLLVSTFATLVVIPCAYGLLRVKRPAEAERDRAVEEADHAHERGQSKDGGKRGGEGRRDESEAGRESHRPKELPA